MTGTGQRGLASVKDPLQATSGWNTQSLGMRMAGDATAAAAAGGLVSPLITMIDKGIIENASGGATISNSIKSSLSTMIFRPQNFFFAKPFLLIFCLYGGTYLSANWLDTAKSTIKNKPASNVSSGVDKFAATSAANLSLCLYKDSQFTKLFGAATSSGKVPPLTYGLFAVRDSLTIMASFNLVPIMAPLMPMTAEMEKFASRSSVSQFVCPAAAQLLSTPLHLWGLDVYNRNSGVSFFGRFQRVARDYVPSSLARMCRIVPAFGVGGVVNTRVRSKWMEAFA